MNEQTEYQEFIRLFKQIDPNGYQMYEILTMVRAHGYGKIELQIQNNTIVKVEQTLGYKLI